MGLWNFEYLSKCVFINTERKSCVMGHDKQCKEPIRELQRTEIFSVADRFLFLSI